LQLACTAHRASKRIDTDPEDRSRVPRYFFSAMCLNKRSAVRLFGDGGIEDMSVSRTDALSLAGYRAGNMTRAELEAFFIGVAESGRIDEVVSMRSWRRSLP